MGPENAQAVALLDGSPQAVNGQWVFAAHVNVTFGRAHGKAGDGHAFQDLVRIALQYAAIHEGAGIALVGVADDQLAVILALGDHGPLEAGGIAGAASAAEPTARDRVDHFLGRHAAQRLAQGFVTVGRDGGLDPFRLHEAAVFQDHRYLLAEEGLCRIDALSQDRAAPEPSHDGWGLLDRYLAVQRVFGIDLDQRAFAAHPQATHGGNPNALLKSRGANGLLQALHHAL